MNRSTKEHIYSLLLVPVLLANLGLLLGAQASAQNFQVLHSFSALVRATNSAGQVFYSNSDGAGPSAPLVLAGDGVFGTASGGGSSGGGAVFMFNIDGTGFTVLHNFDSSDGALPGSGLILSSNTLYGTTEIGGNRDGTVFAINTNGSAITVLYAFNDSDNNQAKSTLVLSDNMLYGTSIGGGTSANGEVFSLNTDGTSFATLYSFSGPECAGPCINSDGAGPLGRLALSGNTLYGTTHSGGGGGNGTVFALNTDGTGFTTLHNFTSLHGYPYVNSDGAWPSAGLILSGNTLYGTTQVGGASGGGTVFALNTDGTGFTTLHSFKAGGPNETITGGAFPNGLILSGSTLYGPTQYAGSEGGGTVFALNTDGTGFTVLHNFPPEVTDTDTNSSPLNQPTNSDGAMPQGSLALLGNTLYGITAEAGSGGSGAIFRISFSPQLNITASGASLILTWPTNFAGFDYSGYSLRSTTNLRSSAAWIPVFPAPVVVNGQNTVTNPISGAQEFYRLEQ